YGLSAGAVNLWPLAWVAPVPVLWLALRVGPRRALIAAFLAYAVGRVGAAPVLLAVVPPAVVAAASLAGAACFAVIVVLSRAIALRFDLRLYALAFPLLWTSWEELLIKPIGGGGELGFSQVDFLPVIQLASLTGVVGVSFIVTFAAALVATVLALRERERPWRGMALIGLTVVIAVVAFGGLRLASAPQSATVQLGVAVTDQWTDRFRTERADEAIELADGYVRRTRDLAGRGAQVVVLPEK